MMETPEPDGSADTSAGTSADLTVPAADVGPVEDATSQSSSHVGNVLAQVKERGFITTGEIFAAFPDLEPDADELRDLWEMFESRGIKVLDEIAEELQLEDQRRAGVLPAEPVAPLAEPRRRATEHREHRPGGTSRPAAGARAPEESTNANADAELAAVR